jgi:hypothetical protein
MIERSLMNRSRYRTRLPRFSSNALSPFKNGRIAETTELLVAGSFEHARLELAPGAEGLSG